ncbi:MAG: septum formation inhibitor Maf [Rhizobiales bacterium]|nr:septum formation inhibitor Maf [Hyphomicrobiales bacterium]
MSLWLADKPLVLASKSVSRRALLQGAGIPIEVLAADIDERGIEANAGLADPAAVAVLLAKEKALAVSKRSGQLVIGADQTLALGQRRFSKPIDRDAARAQLKALRGHAHALHSAVAIMRDGKPVFEHCAVVRLVMRAFSDTFLESYLDAAGDAVTSSVGAYQVEGLGVQLFERIDGDHSTILGLPLLPVLDALRREGALST